MTALMRGERLGPDHALYREAAFIHHEARQAGLVIRDTIHFDGTEVGVVLCAPETLETVAFVGTLRELLDLFDARGRRGR